MERIGILGGTFDPVHIGHLLAGIWTREALHLDRVLMVVANEPWQKAERLLAPAADRLAVVEAATEDTEGLEASALEIGRGGVSYSADTVAELRADRPSAELFLIVGADVAAELASWQRTEEIAKSVTLVVVNRRTPSGAGPTRDPDGWLGSVEHVHMPAIDTSSSELRERLATGRSVELLIPEKAMHVIRDRGLYSVGR